MSIPSRRSVAVSLSIVVAGSLACASLIAAPAQAVSPSTTVSAASQAPAQVSAAKTPHVRAPRVPVWVTLGGGSNVSGATVRVFNAKGQVVDAAKTNASGFAFVNRAKLPSGPFTIKVSGGKSLASAGVRELTAREWLGKNQSKALAVSPVTAMAFQAAKQSGSSYSAAMKKIKSSLQIPGWTTPIQANTSAVFFSGPAFLSWAKSNGGVTAAMRTISNGALAGKAAPSFARPAVLKTTKSKTRTAASTAVWLGGQVLGKVIGGSAGAATSAAIGDVLGTSNPSASDVAAIAQDLGEIVDELNTIETQQQELIALVSTANYNTVESTVSDVVDKTIAQWVNYQSLLSEYGQPTFESDAVSFADDWYADFNGGIDDYESLFSTNGSEGLLQAAYGVYPYTFWTSNEVNNLTSTIQYYGTVYGQTAALLNEAWWDRGQTSSYINIENSAFQTLSNNIYFELPTAIDDSTIVNPSTQVMYKAWPATVNEVWENTSRGNNENPSCNSKGSPLNAATEPWPVVQSSNTNWASLWQGKISDQSWTVSPSSDFAWLQKSNSGGSQTQWTLPTIVSGAPTGWVLVGSDTQPIGGFQDKETAYGAKYYEYENFMWCYSTSASLVKSSPSSWTFNVATDTSGNATYSGTTAVYGNSAPVGVLAHKSGNFAYRNPS